MAAKVVVVPLGTVDLSERFGDKPKGTCLFRETEYPRILTVASIDHHKGLHDAVLALAGLVGGFPRLRYLIIGSERDPRYAAHLKLLVRRLQMTRHVSFLSNISDSQKLVALKEADLYLQPSHEEGFCLAFLEAAMNTGRLVGTNVGEMPGIAASDPLTSIVPRMDSGALRQSILTLLRVPVSRELLSLRRMTLGKKYSWTKCAADIVSLYENILANPSVPGEPPFEV
jgi:glycosyltransferase involved in cell wall biosynthesis